MSQDVTAAKRRRDLVLLISHVTIQPESKRRKQGGTHL